MTIEQQLENYKNGFPYLKVISAATPARGILVLSDDDKKKALDVCNAFKGSIVKFVPASGAASRMFKDLFEAKDLLEAGGEVAEGSPAAKFLANIRRFPFYCPEGFDGKGSKEVLEVVLTDKGLNYGSKPKGQLLFHSYPQEVRTAFEEHLVEGAMYAKTQGSDVVKMHFTVSPEHMDGFVALLDSVKGKYEERFGCQYHISFSTQKAETDMIAVNEDNTPFLKEDGQPLFRPGGHGALLSNLNDTVGDVVVVKNIDNVVKEGLIGETVNWKKILIGTLLDVQSKVFGYLRKMDECEGCCQELCDEIEKFLDDTFCVKLPADLPAERRCEYLRGKLDRPIRVCGMVKNEGEPGGGPYVVYDADGSTSLQILEGAQLNTKDAAVDALVKEATHFNPVDLVCSYVDYKGGKFDLSKYTDPATGFISSKSYQGRKLKAQELPGLWNGSMSNWNTLFVEVPLITFNPVKTVLDLLRKEHCSE